MSTKFFRIVSLIKLKDRVQTHNRARASSVSEQRAQRVFTHSLQRLHRIGRNSVQGAVISRKPCRHNPARTTEANRTRDLRVSTSVGVRIASLSASFSAFYCDFSGSDFFEMIQAKVKASTAKEGSTVEPGHQTKFGRGGNVIVCWCTRSRFS